MKAALKITLQVQLQAASQDMPACYHTQKELPAKPIRAPGNTLLMTLSAQAMARLLMSRGLVPDAGSSSPVSRAKAARQHAHFNIQQ